jgi:hypothetical protein
VLQQPVVLRQVVHRVPVSAMDPGGSELQSRLSWNRMEEEKMKKIVVLTVAQLALAMLG